MLRIDYLVEVKNGEGKAKQAIFHNPAKVSELHTIVGKLPNENRFKVLVGPSQSEAPIQVKIFNQQGKVLLEETIESKDGFSKIYDLSSITDDHVTFYLSKGQATASFERDLNQ